MAAKYRLQALLTVRERMKKKAEHALAFAIRKLKEEKDRLVVLEKQLKKIRERWKEARRDMSGTMSAGPQVGVGNVHVNFLRKLEDDEETKKQEITDQELAIEEAEGKVRLARQEYIDATQQLQIMQKHKELWEKKMRGELSRREAKRLNELGTVIHQLKRWRGEQGVFEVVS